MNSKSLYFVWPVANLMMTMVPLFAATEQSQEYLAVSLTLATSEEMPDPWPEAKPYQS